MSEPSSFFVPDVTPGQEEAAYAELAALCHRPIPEAQARLYSITFDHDGEEWTATVGQPLSCVRLIVRRSVSKKIEAISVNHLGNADTVVAIFDGHPLVVVTNRRVSPGVRWDWLNPFYVGKTKSATYFRAGPERK
jgi:hypothetical protein